MLENFRANVLKLLIAGFHCHAIQNKNQNHSIDKVQILRKERR